MLNATFKHHLDNLEGSEIVARIREDFYIDDLVSGGDSVETAKDLYDTSTAIMLEAGFDLRKWVTNDPELQEYISATVGERQDAQGQGDEMSYFEVMTRNLVIHNKCVLGVGWDTLTGEFVFQFEDIYVKTN